MAGIKTNDIVVGKRYGLESTYTFYKVLEIASKKITMQELASKAVDERAPLWLFPVVPNEKEVGRIVTSNVNSDFGFGAYGEIVSFCYPYDPKRTYLDVRR